MSILDKLKHKFETHVNYEEIPTSDGGRKRLQYLGVFFTECYKSVIRHQTINAASALSFKSIVALVPLIFIGIAVASMLGTSEHENYVQSFISSIETKFPDVPQLQPLLDLIRSFAAKAKEIVGVSFIVLFYIAYTLIANIEKAFNAIWQVQRKRKLLNRLVAYFAAIIAIPIMMSFSVYLNSQVELVTIKVAESIEQTKDEAYALIVSHLNTAGSQAGGGTAESGGAGEEDGVEAEPGLTKTHQSFMVKVTLGLLSLTLTAFAVFLLIVFMPYTRVKIFPALIGGFFSGIILELMKLGFSYYVNYSATSLTRLYGSTLLVFPVFLIWVWMVWSVILLGAEIAFNIQNYYDLVTISHIHKKGYHYELYLAVLVMAHICKSFYNGEARANMIDYLAQKFSTPPLIIRNIMVKLLDHGLIREVKTEEDAYTPGRDIAQITVYTIFKAIHKLDLSVPVRGESRIHELLHELFSGVRQEISSKLEAVDFLALVKEDLEDDELNRRATDGSR